MSIPNSLARKLGIVGKGVAAKRIAPTLRGIECTVINLHLPYPPVLNHLYVNGKKGRFLSKRGREYKKAVAEYCQENGVGHITGRLKVEINAYPPDRRIRDLDGIPKIVLDALGEAGVFADDSQVDELIVKRRGRLGHLLVEITKSDVV